MVKVKKDLIGQTFGMWFVLEQAEDYIKPDGEHVAMWKCQCSCGNIKSVKGYSLKSGESLSCGCYRKAVGSKRIIDLVGLKFGRLTVIKRANNCTEQENKGGTKWLCECECGNKIVTLGRSLKSGATKSCGCLCRERASENSRSRFIDLTGKVFGKLTVVNRAENKNGSIYWNCLCECGNKTCVSTNNLRNGHVCSCGCSKHDKTSELFLKNLTGRKFGELTVIERAPTRKGATYWKCVCSCGNETTVASTNLLRGKTMSCGCLVSSFGENKILKYLESNQVNYENQKRFFDCRDKNPLPFDFYLPEYNTCIEYDGIQHFEPVGFGAGKQEAEDNFRLTNKHDKIKTEYCKEKGINLIRIPYTEFDNIEAILKENLN